MTDAIHHTTATADWAHLMTPLHPDAAGQDDPVWKDNAFLGFWDPDRHIFGSVHVSTSPNAPRARRARCSMLVAGGQIEIIETLDVGTFDGESVSFGLDGLITIEHPQVSATLTMAPLLSAVDYSATDVIPPLVAGKPLQHFQQAATVRGSLNVEGRPYEVDGQGLRDRTWGFRDESSQWLEYAALMSVFDGAFVTAMKFLLADGTTRADGFIVDADGVHPVTDIRYRRTAAAQFVAATITVADGSTHTITMVDRHTGFFVPMGSETDGPAFGTYDDFMSLDYDGRPGGGFCEQGILHRVC
jgi:hypothetical protein